MLNDRHAWHSEKDSAAGRWIIKPAPRWDNLSPSGERRESVSFRSPREQCTCTTKCLLIIIVEFKLHSMRGVMSHVCQLHKLHIIGLVIVLVQFTEDWTYDVCRDVSAEKSSISPTFFCMSGFFVTQYRNMIYVIVTLLPSHSQNCPVQPVASDTPPG